MDLTEQLLQAGMAQFAKRGVRFTMQEVATAAHVSKKTIYTVYDSKEALLLGMVEYGFGRIQACKAELLAQALPLPEKLRRVMIALPPDYALLDFRQLRPIEEKYPTVARAVRRRLESDWEPVLALLQEGIAQGIFRPVCVPVFQMLFTYGIMGALENADAGDARSYRETLSAMMDIFMDGVVSDSAKGWEDGHAQPV
jgi:AcrR family transcriptional regulator